MTTLAKGKTATIHGHGNDRYGRLLATVEIEGDDLGLRLVAEGLAWHYVQFNNDPLLAAAEQKARAARRGLWADLTLFPLSCPETLLRPEVARSNFCGKKRPTDCPGSLRVQRRSHLSMSFGVSPMLRMERWLSSVYRSAPHSIPEWASSRRYSCDSSCID